MSRKSACLSVLLVLFGGASHFVPASAQHFEKVKGNLTGVVAGRNEVFGIDTKLQVWRYSASSKSFSKIENASLIEVEVGGGTLSQVDEVWGIDADGDVYRFDYSKKEFLKVPGSLYQITVGVGNRDDCHPYEVWGSNATVIFRYNYRTKQFAQIAGSLFEVATGGGDVWGVNWPGQIFHFNFGTESWDLVPGKLQLISVGVNDVWGVDINGDALRYDPKTGAFNNVGGAVGDAYDFQAGGDGVWIRGVDSKIYRFDPSLGSFAQVPGAFYNIAVGSGAGVFGVNFSGQVFTFVRP